MSVDESAAVNVTRPGRFWQDEDSAPVLKNGDRLKRIHLHGGLADDGTRIIVRYGENNSATFVRFLRPVHAKYGRCVVIMDNAR